MQLLLGVCESSFDIPGTVAKSGGGNVVAGLGSRAQIATFGAVSRMLKQLGVPGPVTAAIMKHASG